MIKYLVALATFFSLASSVMAQVTCTPTNCTLACDSSCSYQACTKVLSEDFLVEEVPYTLQPMPMPASACEFNADNITEVPFYVDALTYTEIPTTVNKKYKVCET